MDSDSEVIDNVKHQKLLKKINKLGRWKRKSDNKITAIDEKCSLAEDDVNEINFDGLVQSIKSAPNQNQLKKQLTVAQQRNKVLPTPVHRQQKERIEREVAYDQTKKELTKWEDIVEANRLAEQLQFPLDQVPLRLKPVEELLENHVPRTRLEKGAALILSKSKHNLTNKEPYTEAEKEILSAMSLKDAREKCGQMQKLRALISYQESKYRRQKKIKSKQYHRILKRQKRKQLLNDWEHLKTNDPEAANEKLEMLEKDRITERATLKHRGTGKWSKSLRQYAKTDPKMKEVFDEQFKMSRKLTEKHGVESDSDELSESDDEETKLEKLVAQAELGQVEKFLGNTGDNNPWMKSSLTKMKQKQNKNSALTQEVFDKLTQVEQSDPLVPLDSDWNGPEEAGNLNEEVDPVVIPSPVPSPKPKRKRKSKKKKEKIAEKAPSVDPSQVNMDELFDSLDQKILDSAKKSLDDDQEDPNFIPKPRKRKGQDLNSSDTVKVQKKVVPKKPSKTLDNNLEVMANPSQFLKADTQTVITVAPELIEQMDEIDDQDSRRQEALLSEAFADDDVIADFEAEKESIIDAEKPKDIDLTLPGWGDWAGPGAETNPRKKKRFVIKAPPVPLRKDKFLPGVIISEKEDPSIKKLQVSDLPFPYTSVQDFESIIKQPLGKEWNPDSCHRMLTAPNITTKAGTIIRPMDKETTFKKKQTQIIDDNDSY